MIPPIPRGVEHCSIRVKAGITNSTIVFQKIKLAGIAGATPPDTSVWMPDPCIRSVKPGKDGDTAAIIINSKISLKNSSIKGGSSGKGQKSWLCGGVVPLEELGCELCTVGVDGKEGLALKASQSTTIDTMGVILGAMELDATSRIIAGISPALPFQTHEKEFLPVQPKFHSSGKISLDRKADFTIAIYTITGQLLSKQKINGTCWMAPKLNRGIYLIAINVHNSLFRYKLVNM